MRTAASAWLIGVAAAAALIAGAPAAFAHADYRDSDPRDKASVSSPPEEVWAEFTEQPVEGSTVVITDPCGERVDRGDYRYQPFPINRITVSMSADKTGRYSATWTVTSDADGHTTRGTFTFTSTTGEGCPGAGSKGSSGSTERSSSTGSDGSVEQPEAPAGSSDKGTAGSADKRAGRSSGNDAANRTKGQRKGKKGRAESERVDLVQAQDEGRDPSAEEEIPLDWLVVGLLVSALIGAAGGRVYVNIVAPRDRDQPGRPSNRR